MKPKPECIPCLIEVRLRDLNMLMKDEKAMMRAMLKVVDIVRRGLEEGLLGPVVAAHTFKYIREVTGVDDPYEEYKKLSNEVAMRLSRTIERKLESKEVVERIKELIRIAIAGNAVDVGIADYDFDPRNWLTYLKEAQLSKDDRSLIVDLIKRSRRIVYLCDNAGEVIFDKLLMSEIRELGPEITAIVKSYPFQNDVTLKDATEIGLSEVADRVLGSGSGASGLVLEWAPDEVLEEIARCDLIIAKGLGNYEMLSEY
ncbi:MAG: hypothetical protein DRM97_00005, partial [Thermoprotei archaeon]